MQQSLSEEQQVILNHVKTGKNVMVDAVAGTGKTTLILSIANELPEKQILQMTYNSSLRIDVKAKVSDLKLTNMNVHTFHSLAVKYYKSTAFTDTELRTILYKKMEPVRDIPKFDIIVLDEDQDMSPLYFQFIVKFIRDMGEPIQLLILGDYMQGLYEFKGADVRFLTMADTIWNGFELLNTNEFIKCTMKMSFRITNQICSFVNDVMLGEPRMQACRDDQSVTYIRQSRMNIHNIIIAEIYKLFDKGIKPCDIFILGSSVKGINGNIRKLENSLVEKNIPCYIPFLENDKFDDRVIQGKIVFSTFHAVKGRQRKYVIVVGFDNSYYHNFDRSGSKTECPNTFYVASTRAINGLYLMESNEYRHDRPLKFLKKSHIEMKPLDYIDFRGIHQTNFIDKEQEETADDIARSRKSYVTPTELIRFIQESIIDKISPIIDRIIIKKETSLEEIDIPSIIETKNGHFEEVSDLNGIAIPSIYYDYLYNCSQLNGNKSNSLLKQIKTSLDKMKKNEHIFLKEIIQTIPDNIESIDEYLYLANIYSAIQEKIYFKIKQIEKREHNWLSDDIIVQCKERMDQIIGKECMNQLPLLEDNIINENDELHIHIDEFLKPVFNDSKLIRFNARVDLISQDTVWELKCTSKTSIEHKLQLVIYAWLWRMRSIPENNSNNIDYMLKEFKLFNIRTGELFVLDASMDDLNTIMIELLKNKYYEEETKTDEEFIRDCRAVIDLVDK